MRSYRSTFIALLLISFSVHPLMAAPAPAKRSFRPVIPIKQNVRGGMDQMKSQSVTLKIPSPSLPDLTAASNPSTDDTLKSETKSFSEASNKSLPPEPAEKLEDEGESPKTSVSTEEKGHADELSSSSKKIGGSTPQSKSQKSDGPTLEKLRKAAHELAKEKLTYVFGADDPDSGGLDCSSTIQYLLNKIGVDDVPRTSYDQYDWLKRKKLLDDVYGKTATKKLFKKLSPGDLIFWGGTWKSGHRVSHVMLYMGYDPASDKHYVFGARGKSVKGLTGSGVDIFELEPERGRLIAHGKIPGLIY